MGAVAGKNWFGAPQTVKYNYHVNYIELSTIWELEAGS